VFQKKSEFTEEIINSFTTAMQTNVCNLQTNLSIKMKQGFLNSL